MKAKIEIYSYIIENIKNIILAQEVAAKKGDAKSVKSLTMLLNKELNHVKDITFEICDQLANQPFLLPHEEREKINENNSKRSRKDIS